MEHELWRHASLGLDKSHKPGTLWAGGQTLWSLRFSWPGIQSPAQQLNYLRIIAIWRHNLTHQKLWLDNFHLRQNRKIPDSPTTVSHPTQAVSTHTHSQKNVPMNHQPMSCWLFHWGRMLGLDWYTTMLGWQQWASLWSCPHWAQQNPRHMRPSACQAQTSALRAKNWWACAEMPSSLLQLVTSLLEPAPLLYVSFIPHLPRETQLRNSALGPLSQG